MTERLRSGGYDNSANVSPKMANGLSPRSTTVILVIVVGCFAVLIPQVFYPMLLGSATRHLKPSPIDKTTGCCDMISETDVKTIKIMSELCSSIIKREEDKPLSGREIVAKCRSAVLETCGIDIAAVLQEQVRLGQSFKQILDEVRSLNGSLCLKYNFGVAPWRLGVPHRLTTKVSPTFSIRQERPHHLRSEMVHPAFRERGRAIPHQQVASPSRPPPRMVEGRPGPIPGLRPTMGGAGHIVPPPKHSTGIVGLVMPFYTIAIVIFFTYTVMKLMFKKQPETLYPPTERDPAFRKEVFESERNQAAAKLTREGVSSKLVVNAMSALLDEVDHEIESRRKVADQDVVSNGTVVNQQDDEQASVKVLGMEMTASCEGGKKWSRPDSPVLPHSPPPASERVEPPQEIFLEGALPAQSQLLVADSATEAQRPTSEEDPAVVLAGKMTLSVISLDSSENGTDESSTICRKEERRTGSDVSEDFEKIEADVRLQDQIEDIIKQAQDLSGAGMKNEFNSEEVEVDKSEERHKTLDDISKEFLAEEVVANERELTPQLPESEITIEDDAETGTSVTEETPVTTEEAAEQLAVPAEAAAKVETNKQPKSSASPLDLEISKEFLTDKVVAKEQELTEETPADVKVETNEEPEEQPKSSASPLDLEISKEFLADKVVAKSQELTEETPADVTLETNEQPKSSASLDLEISKEVLADKVVAKEQELTEETPADVTVETNEQPEEQPKSSASPLDLEISKEVLADKVVAKEQELTEETPADVKVETKEQPESVASSSDLEISKELLTEKVVANEQELTKDTRVPTEEATEQLATPADAKVKTNEQPPASLASPLDLEIRRLEEQLLLTETEDGSTSKPEVEEDVGLEDEETEDGFEKLNEAIEDLSTELRPRRGEEDTVDVEDDEEDGEEEIEYEYEDSDNEEVDEEIRNVERIDSGAADGVNGEALDTSKYGTASREAVAENEISDDEDLDDDEVEVEEIIEYVSDEEEEEAEEIVEPEQRNNVNHIAEEPDTDE